MTTNSYMDDYAGRLCEKYEASLLVLAELNNETYAELAQQLALPVDAGATPSRRSLSQLVATRTGSGSGIGLDLVDLLVDLVVTYRASRTPLGTLIEETSAELRRVNPNFDEARLVERLLALSRSAPISALAIAEDLLAENGAVYIDCRVIRDFRPSYEEDSTGEAVRILRYLSQQRLRVRYWSEGQERVFEVTMRDDDLLDLEKWLFRARSKLPLVPEPSTRQNSGDEH